MNMHLVVVRPFAGLPRGARVRDAARVAEILAGPNRYDVVRVRTNPVQLASVRAQPVAPSSKPKTAGVP